MERQSFKQAALQNSLRDTASHINIMWLVLRRTTPAKSKTLVGRLARQAFSAVHAQSAWQSAVDGIMMHRMHAAVCRVDNRQRLKRTECGGVGTKGYHT